MRWTGWAGLTAGLLATSGCVYGYRALFVDARYSSASRPHPSYYCYDCHGYRYFDPYYDWCVAYGFRYRWAAHPQVVTIYRQRYVRIREQHPEYGRYRYRPGYKALTRTRGERDYEDWRAGRRGSARVPGYEDRGKRAAPKGKDSRRDKPRERKEKGGSKERSSERGGSRR